MVRQWSYLNAFNLIHVGALSPIKSLKIFKVFRKTTRFKKFNKGITLMVRKKYAKRKYQTTWLFLTYVTEAWTRHYLNSRQFERFYQALGLFNARAYSADYDVFKVSSLGLESSNGINILSCTKNITERYINYFNMTKSVFGQSLVKDSKLSFVQSISLSGLAASELAYPVATTYENLTYHPHIENVEVSSYSELVAGLDDLVFKHSLAYTSSVRQILTLTTLINVHRTL
jgi:hypothetical protein